MKTNFLMLNDLMDYRPKTRGFTSAEEIAFLKEKLFIEEMDEMGLRNLRDFTVLLFTRRIENTEDFELLDAMNSIVSVIDRELFNRGCEV